MSESVDRVLRVIDAGLQASNEHGAAADREPNQCVRCMRCEPPEGGDLCAGCRSFLLGDSDADPKNTPRPTPVMPFMQRPRPTATTPANEAES